MGKTIRHEVGWDENYDHENARKSKSRATKNYKKWRKQRRRVDDILEMNEREAYDEVRQDG